MKKILLRSAVMFSLALLLVGNNRPAVSGSLPVAKVEDLKEYITSTNVYTTWHLFPGTSQLYKGRRPHGELLTTYVNDIALEALQKGEAKFPPGSIIVKENYGATKVLRVITAMYRVPGFNPDAGNWYWLKLQPDGTVDAAGKLESCIKCHSDAVKQDWVFTER